MNPNLAEENLQTIRTLMERSALYRRALAPIMLLAGVMGLAAAAVGFLLHFDTLASFGPLWITTAALVLSGAFLIARRQALKDDEKFWSPPTRRVAEALSLPFAAGFLIGIVLMFFSSQLAVNLTFSLPFFWALFYGCALHSAGFFISRGVRWFGWVYITIAAITLFLFASGKVNIRLDDNCLMGVFFGGLHLAYGIYLYFTEKKTSAA